MPVAIGEASAEEEQPAEGEDVRGDDPCQGGGVHLQLLAEYG